MDKIADHYAEYVDPVPVAIAWEKWCGETAWSRGLREIAGLGGTVKWFCGYPRSASAIPLSFMIKGPDGHTLPGRSRLRDIQEAVRTIKAGSKRAA